MRVEFRLVSVATNSVLARNLGADELPLFASFVEDGRYRVEARTVSDWAPVDPEVIT